MFRGATEDHLKRTPPVHMAYVVYVARNMMSAAATVVALCGSHGAGKDAIAAVLVREGGFVDLKFARPMKDAVRDLFSLTPDHVDGALKDTVHPTWGITPRAMMQWFGTDVMQHSLGQLVPSIGRHFWSDRLVCAVRNEVGGNAVVISDMRFAHELDALRAEFGDRLVAIRVVRPDGTTATSYGTVSDARHESELASSSLPVDLVITNDGTLEQLETVLEGLSGRPGRTVPHGPGVGTSSCAEAARQTHGAVVQCTLHTICGFYLHAIRSAHDFRCTVVHCLQCTL